MRHLALSLAILALTAACGPPGKAPAGASALAPATLSLTCAAPFTPATTRASLVQTFGAANVTDQTVPGPEGQEMKVTVLFANDPKRRVEIAWGDDDTQTRPADVAIQGAASDWVGPHGLKLGMALDDVEKLNGKAFKISGFGWDYGGFATGWDGGALERDAAGCGATVGFEPANGAPIDKVSGEGNFESNLPAVRAAKARVTRLSIGYPEDKD